MGRACELPLPRLSELYEVKICALAHWGQSDVCPQIFLVSLSLTQRLCICFLNPSLSSSQSSCLRCGQAPATGWCIHQINVWVLLLQIFLFLSETFRCFTNFIMLIHLLLIVGSVPWRALCLFDSSPVMDTYQGRGDCNLTGSSLWLQNRRHRAVVFWELSNCRKWLKPQTSRLIFLIGCI